MGQKPEKWVKNSQKSLNMSISDNFHPSQACTKGRDPPGSDEIKNFYKNHQNRSPGVYFNDIHRFTKPLTSLDLKNLA